MATELQFTGVANHIHVNEPYQINGRGDPKFRLRFYADPNLTDWAAVDAAINEAIQEKWPQGAPVDKSMMQMPWNEGSEDGMPGWYYVNAKSNPDNPPQLYDQAANRVPAIPDQVFRPGSRVVVFIKFYGYVVGTNVGVAAALNAVQLVDNVNLAPVKSGRDYSQSFQPVPGAPPTVAPTAMEQQYRQQQPPQGYQQQQPQGYQQQPQGYQQQPPQGMPPQGYQQQSPPSTPGYGPGGQIMQAPPVQTMGAPAGQQGPMGGYAGAQGPSGAPGYGQPAPGYGVPPGQPGAGPGPGAGAPAGATTGYPGNGVPPGAPGQQWPHQ